MANDEHFFDELKAFSEFAGVADNSNYTPLPEGWVLAVADIVGSTKAIAAGRYKAVNMAGASVISAVTNALGHRDLPFVFGGDGALIAVPPSAVDRTRTVLAAVQTWVAEELDLTLRAALVPMGEIRKAGHDVLVARFGAAAEVSYAMFAGGGASWAEAEMKAGRYAVPKAAPGTRPDLTGLSCRWDPIAARNGEIVSVIAIPAEAADPRGFTKLVGDIIALVGGQERAGHPVPPNGPHVSWVPPGLDYETRAMAPKERRLLPRLAVLFQTFVIKLADFTGRKIGPLDMKVYRADLVSNSDFRKFDDGLKLTVDLDAARLTKLETILEAARKADIVEYGLHRQKDALMTCIVPNPFTRDHIHFIDGAAGGYATAASLLKAGRASA
jgi:predicted NUDIX family NTP pyrophosphohydrolase